MHRHSHDRLVFVDQPELHRKTCSVREEQQRTLLESRVSDWQLDLHRLTRCGGGAGLWPIRRFHEPAPEEPFPVPFPGERVLRHGRSSAGSPDAKEAVDISTSSLSPCSRDAGLESSATYRRDSRTMASASLFLEPVVPVVPDQYATA